jgi:hypothetical protein
MSTNLKVPPEFDHVSKEQRIAFVQELWDRIALDADGGSRGVANLQRHSKTPPRQ